jgi:CHAT domain-containing protein
MAQDWVPQPLVAPEKILGMERGLEQEYEAYFGRDLAEVSQNPEQIAQTLADMGQATGTNPAVLWVMPRADHLHLVLVTPEQSPLVLDRYDAPKSRLISLAQQFQQDITRPGTPNLRLAQQLHDWIVEPFDHDYLQAQGIDTLLVCLGKGLRGLPLAALHDGEQFLIEKYSLTRIPAFNLIERGYDNIRQGQVLAMGASEFEHQSELPAVPVELQIIEAEIYSANNVNHSWQSRSFLNATFTLDNLHKSLAAQPFDIVHLATHAEFRAGQPTETYIQFWDGQLSLDQMANIDWNSGSEPLALLVLSACRSAIGSEEAEMGFAGVALQAGVRSALASLWYVSDTGTLALMGEFYRQLAEAPTKAEALRQAQIQMLRGEVRFDGDHLLLSRGLVLLPDELAETTANQLSHPFYWAAFSLISSPW